MINEISKVKNVTKEDTIYTISLENNGVFGLKIKYGYHPKVGDKIKLDIINGSTVRGVIANGKQIFYKTDTQLEQEHKKWCENYEKEKQKAFKKGKSQLDKDYNNLPKEFKLRIDKFRKNNSRFRIDYESYEMFCCREAIKIANACKTPTAIKKFEKFDYDKQKKLAKISDGHSGNTFSCAIVLAYWYLKEKAVVKKLPGAMSPLVGSNAYGDIAKQAQSSDKNKNTL